MLTLLLARLSIKDLLSTLDLPTTSAFHLKTTTIMPPKSQKPQSRSTSSTKPRVIYWFRTDLRLHDSPALAAALDLQPAVLVPIWSEYSS